MCWIRGTKIISEWGKHCDEIAAAVCERENTELVEGGVYIGDGWKKPVEVVLVDTLREERNHTEKLSGIVAKSFEQWGG